MKISVAAKYLGRGGNVEGWILLLTFCGTLLCGTVAFWPDPPPLDRLAARELRAIGADERRAKRIFQEVWRDFQRGGSPEVAADRLDQEVLPAWRSGLARIEHVRRGRLASYIPERLRAFFKQRESAWMALSITLRYDDPVAAARFRRDWKSAERIAEEIRAGSATP